MKGKIDAAATISLPIANESCNTINVPFGSGDLETFIKESLLMCFEQCNVGDNLVITPTNKYSVTLNEKSEIILVVDISSIEYDEGAGEICRAWQPN